MKGFDLRPTKRLIKMPEVQVVTGLTRTGIYTLIKQGRFPAQIRVKGAKCSMWSEQAVYGWVDQIIEEQNLATSKIA